MLLVGKIGSKDSFEPQQALIIQNKDDLKVPLMLENIPTPQQFANAIESLSPEQQRFAKAYRGMQLASTLFALVVIQIKPQLEKLLNLPDDSLTKEIRLTQDLMELFLKYQIPSDLLSYEGTMKATVVQKLDAVKAHVSSMQEMIAQCKKDELAEQQQITAMAKASVLEKGIGSIISATAARAFGGASGGASAPSGPSSGSGPSQSGGAVELQRDDIDYTKIPAYLDRSFHKYDEDNALHSTIISTGSGWTKSSQKALLAQPTKGSVDQWREKNAAFDLCDSLTRAGVLPIDSAELHVLLAATHCFDSSLINTVVQQNINPIEKVERSNLIVAMAVHNKSADELLKNEQHERVRTYSPGLFLEAGPAKKALTQ
jgi:hypothetical protein